VANVVITGSTKGVGRGLANAFSRLGHNIVITSRRQADIAAVTQEMNKKSKGRIIGQVCDISDKKQVEALWELAKTEFGSVDYWINNAGYASGQNPVHKIPENLIHTMINTNSLGTLFGSQVAIAGFRKQGSGRLYNMLGGSFDGRRIVKGMGVYSSTKASINVLTKYLVAENKNTNIVVGTISPGILITENWLNEQKRLSPEAWKKIRPMINMIADQVETAAPWIVGQMIENKKSGKRIAWLTPWKIITRIVQTKLLGQKRDLFSRYGL
tara:strand:+ start:1593 stop:2402 length:810 start_codon:yes stop_codon:yes gene_type:complete